MNPLMKDGNRQPLMMNYGGYQLPLDPLGANKNKTTGTLFNPIGESFYAGSPAPMFDPMGYAAGWYKPGSTAGKAMNTINDPLNLFSTGFGGLLG